MSHPPRWSLQTPPTAHSALAALLLTGDVEEGMRRLGIRPVPVGSLALRDLCGIDTGIVARWSEDAAHLMPHGGPAVVRALIGAMERAGIAPAPDDPQERYPEAGSLIEARMLAALAVAPSPLAVDLLLDQPRRWSGLAEDYRDTAPRTLDRLIHPPLVVAVGPANVGKSTLLNALAGRTVAIVADQPGTTRDHVGALLELDGLVVRYVDTPGRRGTTDPLESRAVEASRPVIASADLILSCFDAGTEPIQNLPPRPTMRVALRADLGLPTRPFDAAVSARAGEGIGDLAQRIRRALVPDADLADPRPWRFWGAAGGGAAVP